MNKFLKVLIQPFLISSILLVLLIKSGFCIEVSREKIIDIASQAARDLGYDVRNMTIEADENNTAWKDYVAFLKKFPPRIEEKLRNKKYWAVYFAPIDPPDKNVVTLGGDLWVFVDANTGEVLTYRKGV